LNTESITRQAVTLIDRKVATLNQLRTVLIKLGKFADSYEPAGKEEKKSTFSAATLRRMSLAQKARWRKYRKNGKVLHMRKSAWRPHSFVGSPLVYVRTAEYGQRQGESGSVNRV
jgi:hypothetical protein